MAITHRSGESLDTKKHGYFGGDKWFYGKHTATANYVKIPFEWQAPYSSATSTLSATRSKRIIVYPAETNVEDIVFSFNCVDDPDPPSVKESEFAGNPNGTYKYKITFVTAEGESLPSTASNTIVVVNKKIIVTVPLNMDPTREVISRKIYRTINGGADYLYLATIPDNVTTTYLDDVADGDLGALAPTVNTTGQTAGETKAILTFDGASFTAIYVKGTVGDKVKIFAWG